MSEYGGVVVHIDIKDQLTSDGFECASSLVGHLLVRISLGRKYVQIVDSANIILDWHLVDEFLSE